MRKISVIIPCYNAATFIAKCLDALANQTYRDFDVIIIDDCSTDETVSIVEKYSMNSAYTITLLRNEVNSGPAFSRNKGVNYATSEFVAFCDSDDWYAEDFLEKMLQRLEETNSDISFCGYNVVDSKGNVESRYMQGKCFTENIKEALSFDIDSLCMLVVKREIIKDCPFPNIRNGEDMAVIPILLCQCKRFCVLNDCLYFYFTRSTSASNMVAMSVVDSFEKSFKFVKKHLMNDYYTECEYIGMKNWLYAGIITLFTFSFDTKKARQIVEEFEDSFPNWKHNVGIKKLPLYKRIVLILCQHRLFALIRIVALIRAKRK